MQRRAGRTVFAVGKKEYRWEDIVLASHLWGEWAELERRIRQGIACEKRLKDKGGTLPDAEIEEAGDQWRYERDLLSADDMQTWLDERSLDMEEWLEYINRTVARTRSTAKLDDITKAYGVSPDEIDAVIYSETVCSGSLAGLVERLAGQAAVYDRLTSEAKTPRATRCAKADIGAALRRLPRAVRQKGVLELSPKVTLERAEFLACVTLSFGRFVDRIAAPAALEREIEAHGLDWTRLECQTVTFAAEEAAREAALLVREDGLRLAQAASMAKSPLEEVQYVLEDTGPPLRDRLTGALPGDLIGPLSADGVFLLVSVMNRVEPSSKDPSIRSRAGDRVVRRTIEREVAKRVHWHERF